MNIEKYYKISNTANIIFNVIVCLLLYFFFHGNLALIILSAIVFDVILRFSKDIITGLYAKWIIKNSHYDITNFNSYDFPYSNKEYQRFIREKVTFEIYTQKKKLETLEQKKKEQEKSEEEILKRIKNNDIKKFEELRIEIEEMDSIDENEELKNRICEIREKFFDISIILENNQESIKLIPISLYTYTKECIKLINDYEKINIENREKYIPSYIEMLNEFTKFLNKLYDKLSKANNYTPKIELKTLTEELREENMKASK